MTIPDRDIALVDELLAEPESDCVEYKHNNTDRQRVGKLVSALSNTARIEQKSIAYILWGIEDGGRRIIGTDVDFRTTKYGNQGAQIWLSQQLSPNLHISFHHIAHPSGNVVLCKIPAATAIPTEFGGAAYIRVGSATSLLSQHPERYQALIKSLLSFAWEKGIAKSYVDADAVLQLLDYETYFALTKQVLPSGNTAILERLLADNLITADAGDAWNITNMGALLFAHDITQFDTGIARKAIRLTTYAGVDKTTTIIDRQDGTKGYAIGFEGLIGYIDARLPATEPINGAFRERHPLFPIAAIRELVANALIHQDMTRTGAGPLIEVFQNRVEITNPGESLVPQNRMIDSPPESRNEALASLMRRMNLCEELGTGLDKVIVALEDSRLPPLRLVSDVGSTRATIYGPRSFAKMSVQERITACYQHAVLKYIQGEKMQNASLRDRLGVDKKNAAQVSNVINSAMKEGLLKHADPSRPRAGYYPSWG